MLGHTFSLLHRILWLDHDLFISPPNDEHLYYFKFLMMKITFQWTFLCICHWARFLFFFFGFWFFCYGVLTGLQFFSPIIRLSLTFLCSVAQWCLTLCDPLDCSLPSISVHGIFQARILEWVAISKSRGSSQPRDQTLIFCVPALQADSLPNEQLGKTLVLCLVVQ